MRQGVGDTPSLHKYLTEYLPEGSRIGLDGSVHTVAEIRKLESALKSKGHKSELEVDNSGVNLVDTVWDKERVGPNKQSQLLKPIRVHPMKYAGQSTADKLRAIRDKMSKEKAAVCVFSALDEICWILNIRGNDSPFNQLVEGYVIVTHDQVIFCVDNEKLSPAAKQYLLDADSPRENIGQSAVVIEKYENAMTVINRLSDENKRHNGKFIWLDDTKTSYSLFRFVAKFRGRSFETSVIAYRMTENYLLRPSCVALMKACKNEAELRGIRNAHIRDGIAMVHALCELQTRIRDGTHTTEIDVDTIVCKWRANIGKDAFLEPSFPTIAGSGGNGAVVHYRY
jgi:Xaa-Pro aminopeptidase